MRISDLSSDVCYSDLLGFLRRDQRSVVQRRAIDQPALFEHFDHCFQVDQFADDAFRICECLAGLHLTETEAQGLADSLRDLRAFLSGYIKQVFVVVHAGSSSVTVDGTGATASPRRSRRSEEHTSELQSLMRISYAVFC